MARTSLKDEEEINIQENIFRGNHVADMQRELDLCDYIVYDAPASVVDTLSVLVCVLTTYVNAGGAEESSKKPACRGRITAFLILLYLFWAKRKSKY